MAKIVIDDAPPRVLFVEPSASNFGMRLFRALLILEATYPLPIIGPIKSATYLLLEMELCLHHTNKGLFADNFNDYSRKAIFHFRFVGVNVDFVPINLPFP
jgi:hypothetical protein